MTEDDRIIAKNTKDGVLTLNPETFGPVIRNFMKYDPKTAFGNDALIQEQRAAEKRALNDKLISKCKKCDPDGQIKLECEACEGHGYLLEDCSHN